MWLRAVNKKILLFLQALLTPYYVYAPTVYQTAKKASF